MAKQVSLKATRRTGIGRTHVKKTRSNAMIPGIVYGSHIQPTPIQVNEKEVENIFKHATSENMLIELSLDEGGKTSNRLTFVQEIQHHPLNDRVMHMDFHEVRADEKLHARVLVVAVGEPEGVKTGGGVLEQVLRELEVECLPKDLPERLNVDVSALQIGGNIHVDQVKVPNGVTILNQGNLSVFTVLAPKEEEVAPAAAAAATEPELIKKKTEDGEEAPADAKAAPAAKGDAKAAAPAAKGGDAKAAAPKAEKK